MGKDEPDQSLAHHGCTMITGLEALYMSCYSWSVATILLLGIYFCYQLFWVLFVLFILNIILTVGLQKNKHQCWKQCILEEFLNNIINNALCLRHTNRFSLSTWLWCLMWTEQAQWIEFIIWTNFNNLSC
jgi:hypothetical protein